MFPSSSDYATGLMQNVIKEHLASCHFLNPKYDEFWKLATAGCTFAGVMLKPRSMSTINGLCFGYIGAHVAKFAYQWCTGDARHLNLLQDSWDLETEEFVETTVEDSTCTTDSSATDEGSQPEVVQEWKTIPGRYHLNVAHRVKNKFGIPRYNLVNLRAVRDYASKIMASDGHRPSHINRDMPRIVSLVFTPTRDDQTELEHFTKRGPARANLKYHSQLPNGN